MPLSRTLRTARVLTFLGLGAGLAVLAPLHAAADNSSTNALHVQTDRTYCVPIHADLTGLPDTTNSVLIRCRSEQSAQGSSGEHAGPTSHIDQTGQTDVIVDRLAAAEEFAERMRAAQEALSAELAEAAAVMTQVAPGPALPPYPNPPPFVVPPAPQVSFSICDGPHTDVERAIEQLIAGGGFRVSLTSIGDGCAVLGVTAMASPPAVSAATQLTFLSIDTGAGRTVSVHIVSENETTRVTITTA